MNNSLLGKTWARFVQQSLRNVCAKFKVDPLSRFRTGARQVFTTQKLFLSKIPLTMKTATSNSLKTHFLIKLQSAKFLLTSFTSNKSILKQKSKYFIAIRVFPFFISFFCWNEMNKKSSFNKRRHEKEQTQSPQPATLLRKRLCHRCFPENFAKFLRTPFLTEHIQWLLLKYGKL